MLISLKLKDSISCEHICHMLEKAISIYQKTNDITDSLLVIDIQKINDDTSLIPKLEHKILNS
jgi:hypothetical protein